MLARFYIGLIFFCFGLASVHAYTEEEKEFFDDTTKQIYSEETTLYLTLAELKYNQSTFRPVSFSIHKSDRFTYKQKASYRLQDLGNEGTAAKPTFYQLPTHIGANPGFYVYDIYFANPLFFKYYNTKSPYTDGSLIFARLGSYNFEVCHHRSFNANWHLGASLGTMLIDKEFFFSESGDRNVIAYAPFALVAHYQTDQAKYQVLASFYRRKHRVRETGGIAGYEPRPLDWLKPKNKSENNLDAADEIETSQLRQQYHLYQQFKWIDALQPYQEIDLTNQFNAFKAPKLSYTSKNYLGPMHQIQADSTKLSMLTDSLEETTVSKSLAYEWGVKGDIDKLYYRGYYINQKLTVEQPRQSNPVAIKEHYLGLQTRLKLSEHQEFLDLNGGFLVDGMYQMHTAYQGKYIELGYAQMKHKPALLVQKHHGPFRSWQADLKPPIDHQIYGAIKWQLPNLLISPQVKVNKIIQPIYFKQIKQAKPTKQADALPQATPIDIAPQQAHGYANLFHLTTELNATLFAYFHADNAITFAQAQGPAAHAFSMPKWFVNTRLYYARTGYDNKADIETGLDIHWHSPYKADGYDPVTQQFYRQNQFTVLTYPVADLFIAFRISTFRAFVKLINLNQHLALFGGTYGYFTTPYYPGQNRSVDVGISWSFFD